MSVQLRQSLQVTSILSTLMLAPSAAHALMYVLTRQSHSHNGNANVNVNANRPKKWLSSCEGNHFLYTLYFILYTYHTIASLSYYKTHSSTGGSSRSIP